MEAGTSVRCVYPDGRLLTQGKRYIVLGHHGDWITVCDDSGRDNRYPLVRFRIEDLAMSPIRTVLAETRSPLPALSILRAGARL